MPPTPCLPMETLNAIEDLMKKVTTVMNSCITATNAAKEILTAVDEHNMNAEAHPIILEKLKGAGAVTTDMLDERIKQHDESPAAHEALMNKIEQIIGDMSTVQQAITDNIKIHNEDKTSHSDIREILNGINASLATIDLPNLSSTLESLRKQVFEVHVTQIAQLQSVDAAHDSQLYKDRVDIDYLLSSIDNLQEQIIELSKSEGQAKKDNDSTLLDAQAGSLGDKLGLESFKENGPNLVNLQHTLPIYVGRNKSVQFAISGATSKTGSPLEYSLRQGQGDYVLSQSEHLVDDQPITMAVGNANAPKDQLYMIVDAKDTGNDEVTSMVINTLVADAIDLTRVSCYGLPSKVEPGNTYTFKIRNLSDIDDGRFTYTLSPVDTGFEFDKLTGLLNGEEVRVTIPTTVDRDVDYTFQLIVHDEYNADGIKSVTVHINAIPGAEDFKHNLPKAVVPGEAYFVRFSGVLSPNGTPANYNIVNNNDTLTFSKVAGILPNENVVMEVASDAQRGDDYNFIVEAYDENMATVSIDLGVTINDLPSIELLVVSNLPTESKGGRSVSITLDLIGDATELYYFEIDPLTTGFIFDKTKQIHDGEMVTFSIPKVNSERDYTFYIWITDVNGEKSVEPYKARLKVLPVYEMDQPRITSPVNDDSVLVDFSVTWTAASTYIDMS